MGTANEPPCRRTEFLQLQSACSGLSMSNKVNLLKNVGTHYITRQDNLEVNTACYGHQLVDAWYFDVIISCNISVQTWNIFLAITFALLGSVHNAVFRLHKYPKKNSLPGLRNSYILLELFHKHFTRVAKHVNDVRSVKMKFSIRQSTLQ